MDIDWIKRLDDLLEEGGTAVMEPPPQLPEVDPWAQLVEGIERAVLVADLDPVMDAIQADFERDRLTQAQAEALALRAAEKARRLAPVIADMPLAQFIASDKTQVLRSHVLGEDILLAGEQAQIPPDNTLVVYWGRELTPLLGMPPEQLKTAHRIKTLFDGEVVQNE